MGELIEFSIVSSNKSLYTDMLNFLEHYLSSDNEELIISIMDNWYYDNKIKINSLKEAEDFMETKIVTVEKNIQHESIGVFIEKNKNGYIIDCWINLDKEIIGKQYTDLINEIIKCFKGNKKLIICGIGKEISIDYDKKIIESIKESHNIDCWIVSKQFYIDNELSKLNLNVNII
ncbi:MAG: hypothetical protein HFK00_08850 [Oscillospiraceae bacterium]|nr:hypothetical protein [Oscillospiraceae bacterium]